MDTPHEFRELQPYIDDILLHSKTCNLVGTLREYAEFVLFADELGVHRKLRGIPYDPDAKKVFSKIDEIKRDLALEIAETMSKKCSCKLWDPNAPEHPDIVADRARAMYYVARQPQDYR